MAVDDIIAQGVQPIGANLPQTALALQQMRGLQQENALRQIQTQQAEVNFQRSNALYDAQQKALSSGDPSAVDNFLRITNPQGWADLQKGAQTQLDVRMAQLKQALMPAYNTAVTIAKSANPAALLAVAPKNVQDFVMRNHPGAEVTDPDEMRALATEYANHYGGMMGLPPIDLPQQFITKQGPNGAMYSENALTHQPTALFQPQNPTFALEKVTSTDGKVTGIPFQTGGYGAGAAAKGMTQAGGKPPAGIDLGVTPPSEANSKAAVFANYARSGLAALDQLESQGVRLSPKDRGIITHAATSENESLLPNMLTQYLLAHGLSKDGARYMAAALPLLQASSHSMAGARVTTSQLLTNFESLIPNESGDPDYLKQVQANRQNLYRGFLAESGPAAYLPEYKNTIGADRDSIRQNDVVSNAPLDVGQSRSFNGVTLRRVK